MLQNRDWQNWKESLPVETGDPEKHSASLRHARDTPISRKL